MVCDFSKKIQEEEEKEEKEEVSNCGTQQKRAQREILKKSWCHWESSSFQKQLFEWKCFAGVGAWTHDLSISARGRGKETVIHRHDTLIAAKDLLLDRAIVLMWKSLLGTKFKLVTPVS